MKAANEEIITSFFSSNLDWKPLVAPHPFRHGMSEGHQHRRVNYARRQQFASGKYIFYDTCLHERCEAYPALDFDFTERISEVVIKRLPATRQQLLAAHQKPNRKTKWMAINNL